ncbi:unknown [Clostridium sp. CAG:122]|nr:unknown [Clostridium sp. CAG:122]
MLIVVDFAVTFVVVFVVFVSTALAMNCVVFVPKVVVVEELSVTVIVFCDVFFAVTDCVLKKSGVKMPVHKTVVAAVRDIAFFNVWFVCFFFILYYLLLWKFLQLPMGIIA